MGEHGRIFPCMQNKIHMASIPSSALLADERWQAPCWKGTFVVKTGPWLRCTATVTVTNRSPRPGVQQLNEKDCLRRP